MIRVRLPVGLRGQTEGNSELALAGGTVAECLEDLGRRFPGVRSHLWDQGGGLAPAVSLYVNGDDVRYRSGLDTPLEDGDELRILLPIAGGA